MNQDDFNQDLHDDLRRTLQMPAGPCTAGEPIDDLTLAEYIDGVLPTEQQHEVEAHLAACAACRQLMSEASSALESVSEPALGANRSSSGTVSPASSSLLSPSPAAPSPVSPVTVASARRPPAVVWALAALLVLALAASWWWRGIDSGQRLAIDPRLTALQVSSEMLERVDADSRRRIEAALAGELTPPELFSGVFAGPQPVLRGANQPQGPRLLSPRWSAIRQTRPTLEWYFEAGEGGPPNGELLVVDAKERVVAAIPFGDAVNQQRLAQPWPSELPPLTPGELYAWKASLEIDGDWLASEFVPFRVLAEDEVTARLAPVVANDFLAGLELTDLGLFDEAAERFSRLPATAAVKKQLLRRVLEHKHFDPQTLQLELARWSAASAPQP